MKNSHDNRWKTRSRHRNTKASISWKSNCNIDINYS